MTSRTIVCLVVAGLVTGCFERSSKTAYRPPREESRATVARSPTSQPAPSAQAAANAQPAEPERTAARQAPTAERYSGPEKINVDELVAARLQIPERPLRPRPPRPVAADRAQFANLPARFQGTSVPLFGPDDRVAVIGRQELVGKDSSAGQYVCDMLYAALQARDVSLIDRDYRVVKREEAKDLIGPGRTTGEGLIVLEAREAAGFRESAGSLPTHIVVVHSVEIPNNPLSLTLPLEMPSEEWTRYEAQCSDFMNAVAAYNRAVQAYEDKCHATAQRMLGKFELVSKGPDAERAALRQLHERVEKEVREQGREPTVVTRAPQPYAPSSDEPVYAQDEEYSDARRTARFLDLIGGGLYRDRSASRRAPRRTAPAARGPVLVADETTSDAATADSPLYDWLGWLGEPRTPTLIDAQAQRLYKSPREVLGEQGRTMTLQVEAFQAAISVRVIEMSTSRAVWFGIATAQNLSFAEAMGTAAESLSQHLVKFK